MGLLHISLSWNSFFLQNHFLLMKFICMNLKAAVRPFAKIKAFLKYQPPLFLIFVFKPAALTNFFKVMGLF